MWTRFLSLSFNKNKEKECYSVSRHSKARNTYSLQKRIKNESESAFSNLYNCGMWIKMEYQMLCLSWAILLYLFIYLLLFFFLWRKIPCSKIPNKCLIFPWIMALHWVLLLLLLLLSVEHHLCIGDLSSNRNQGQHKRERKTRKTNLEKLKNVYLIKSKKPKDSRRWIKINY